MVEYADAKATWGHWRMYRKPSFIYLSSSSRLRIQPEIHSEPGFGFDRLDEMNDRGIDESELDAQETPQQMAEEFLDNFSLHPLRVLVPVLQSRLLEWECRQPRRAPLDPKELK